jgi:hypothetical protein
VIGQDAAFSGHPPLAARRTTRLAHLAGGHVALAVVDDACVHVEQGPPDRTPLLLDVIGVDDQRWLCSKGRRPRGLRRAC